MEKAKAYRKSKIKIKADSVVDFENSTTTRLSWRA
jgi:hypothetical protein